MKLINQRDKNFLEKSFKDISQSKFGDLITIERIERYEDEDGKEIEKKEYSKKIYAKIINKEIKEFDETLGGMVIRGNLMAIIKDVDRFYNNIDLLGKS